MSAESYKLYLEQPGSLFDANHRALLGNFHRYLLTSIALDLSTNHGNPLKAHMPFARACHRFLMRSAMCTNKEMSVFGYEDPDAIDNEPLSVEFESDETSGCHLLPWQVTARRDLIGTDPHEGILPAPLLLFEYLVEQRSPNDDELLTSFLNTIAKTAALHREDRRVANLRRSEKQQHSTTQQHNINDRINHFESRQAAMDRARFDAWVESSLSDSLLGDYLDSGSGGHGCWPLEEIGLLRVTSDVGQYPEERFLFQMMPSLGECPSKLSRVWINTLQATQDDDLEFLNYPTSVLAEGFHDCRKAASGLAILRCFRERCESAWIQVPGNFRNLNFSEVMAMRMCGANKNLNQEAISFVKKYLPDDSCSLYQLEVFYERLDDHESALEACQKRTEIEKDNPSMLHVCQDSIAEHLRALGRGEEALEWSQKQFDAAQQDVDAEAFDKIVAKRNLAIGHQFVEHWDTTHRLYSEALTMCDDLSLGDVGGIKSQLLSGLLVQRVVLEDKTTSAATVPLQVDADAAPKDAVPSSRGVVVSFEAQYQSVIDSCSHAGDDEPETRILAALAAALHEEQLGNYSTALDHINTLIHVKLDTKQSLAFEASDCLTSRCWIRNGQDLDDRILKPSMKPLPPDDDEAPTELDRLIAAVPMCSMQDAWRWALYHGLAAGMRICAKKHRGGAVTPLFALKKESVFLLQSGTRGSMPPLARLVEEALVFGRNEKFCNDQPGRNVARRQGNCDAEKSRCKRPRDDDED